MFKNVLVLSGSPRKRGNSDSLCDQFMNGAEEAGHQTEKIFLRDRKINYCIGCNACQRNGGICVHKDDMTEILEKMIAADVIVLAAPVYFYSMDAQMKTLIDRTYARHMEIQSKKVYLIVTGGGDAEHYFDTAIAGLRGFVICLPDAKEKGIICGIGVSEPGDVNGTPAIEKAYEMGRTV